MHLMTQSNRPIGRYLIDWINNTQCAMVKEKYFLTKKKKEKEKYFA